MIDVRVEYPNLFELFEILFEERAETELLDISNRSKHTTDLSMKNTKGLSTCFSWANTNQGFDFWEALCEDEKDFPSLELLVTFMKNIGIYEV